MRWAIILLSKLSSWFHEVGPAAQLNAHHLEASADFDCSGQVVGQRCGWARFLFD